MESARLKIESIDLEGQGVARRDDGKVVFVEGALIGEHVGVNVYRKKDAWERGVVMHVARESHARVKPRCPHFGLHAGACGGCKMQHLDATAQVAVKQRALEDALWHLGKVRAEQVMRPMEGEPWGYRDRARLSVRYVIKKGVVLVGFHERKSTYVADMRRCEVLAPAVSDLLMPLRELIASMDARDRLPQIEVAVGGQIVALVLRHLVPIETDDHQRLASFAATHGVQWWLQPKGPDSIHPLVHDQASLSYALDAFGVTIDFKPTDFTQVNHRINEALVATAVSLLQPLPNEHVIDWFCGLGNFTLPLATLARSVHGYEGSGALVERSKQNAVRNSLQGKASFDVTNLFDVDVDWLASLPSADAWLVDPPREGAMALCKALADWRQRSRNETDAPVGPTRIVYVSCNPATLARDAGILAHVAGYRLVRAGVVNMFPHTAHVESVALFVRAEVPERAALVSDGVVPLYAADAVPP